MMSSSSSEMLRVNLPWMEIPSVPLCEQWADLPASYYERLLPCSLSFDSGMIGACGEKRSSDDQVRVNLFQGKKQYQSSVFGILLQFPRNQLKNELVRAFSPYAVLISLPPGGFKLYSRPVVVPGRRTPSSQLLVELMVNACVDVNGYGMHFQGRDTEVDGWINENRPIEGIKPLLDILTATEFCLTMDVDTPTLHRFVEEDAIAKGSYPYDFDDILHADASALHRAVERAPGACFEPASHYESDKMLFTVLSQTVVQDFIHLYMDTQTIKSLHFSAHLLELEDEEDPRIVRRYAIVYCKQHHALFRRGTMQSSWVRLQGDPSFRMLIPTVDSGGNEGKIAICQAKPVMDGVLPGMSLGVEEVVYEFSPPSRSSRFAFVDNGVFGWNAEQKQSGLVSVRLLFESDRAQAERKLKALRLSLLDDSPLTPSPPSGEDHRVLKRLQSFSGDFWQGRGFWRSCSQLLPVETGGTTSPMAQTPLLRSVSNDTVLRSGDRLVRPPMVNLLVQNNVDLQSAILQCLLPKDRERFREYMSSALLGVAVITGFAGAGKTEALAATIVSMSFNDSLGAIYASASSNISVSELAMRIDKVARNAVDLYNRHVPSDAHRVTYPLVIRGHNRFQEVDRFIDYVMSDLDTARVGEKTDARWSLPLSGSQWLLKLFRKELSESDPQTLQNLVQNNSGRFNGIQDLLFQHRGLSHKRLGVDERQRLAKPLLGLLDEIVQSADVVCTTPAMAANEPYCSFNRHRARAVAFDDANSISRVDAIALWGNTCRPCVLAGDLELIGPTIKMTDTRHRYDDDDYGAYGNYRRGFMYNRMAKEGAVSVLGWTRTLGWNEFVLDTQLRAAMGLFDLVRDEFYSEFYPLPTYHSSTAITNYPLVSKIDNLLRRKYDISVSPRKVSPVFLHCEKTSALEDPRTLSKFNTGQLVIVLGLLQDLLSVGVRVEDVVILTPYTGNVAVLQRLVRKSAQLSKLQITTVDKYQGKQAEVVVYIFTVTTNAHALFAANPQRLNAAMTRARSAMILVGNLELSLDDTVQTFYVASKKTDAQQKIVLPERGDREDCKDIAKETCLLTRLIGTLRRSGRLIKESYEPQAE